MVFFRFIKILMSLTGMSVIVRCVIVQRFLCFTAVSVPVMPIREGNHMSSMIFFFLIYFIRFEDFGLYHLTGKDFGVVGGHHRSRLR